MLKTFKNDTLNEYILPTNVIIVRFNYILLILAKNYIFNIIQRKKKIRYAILIINIFAIFFNIIYTVLNDSTTLFLKNKYIGICNSLLICGIVATREFLINDIHIYKHIQVYSLLQTSMNNLHKILITPDLELKNKIFYLQESEKLLNEINQLSEGKYANNDKLIIEIAKCNKCYFKILMNFMNQQIIHDITLFYNLKNNNHEFNNCDDDEINDNTLLYYNQNNV